MSLVELTHRDGRATVTLDRPAKRNALSPDLLDALHHALDEAAAAAPRVLVLAGAGPIFCAGGDIEAMQARTGRPQATRAALAGGINRVVEQLSRFPAPTVCKVQGAAMGAGLGLALTCDLVLAARDARLGVTHANLGLTLDGGTSWHLAQRLGPARALELALTARVLTGEEAHAMGLITQAVAPADLAGAVDQLAARLAQGPTRAFVQARTLVQAGTSGSLRDALVREADAQAMMYATADQAEGVAAFLEKREARFIGR